MEKNIMLGVNNQQSDRNFSNYCCILECLIPFSELIPDKIEASDFRHTATNWGGCDKIQRTIEIEKLKPTGNKIVLQSPIVFYGEDDDMGHTYQWKFEVNEIHEVKTE